MKLIVLKVPDHVAEQMTKESAYLDVFGGVRWVTTSDSVEGATGWQAFDTEDVQLTAVLKASTPRGSS